MTPKETQVFLIVVVRITIRINFVTHALDINVAILSSKRVFNNPANSITVTANNQVIFYYYRPFYQLF